MPIDKVSDKGEKTKIINGAEDRKGTRSVRYYAGQELPDDTEPFQPTEVYQKLVKRGAPSGTVVFKQGKEVNDYSK